MFITRKRKNIPDQETSMTLINSFVDVEPFSGRVIAFKTTSFYMGEKNGYKLDDSGTKYALISESLDHWEVRPSDGENNRGYSMSIFLNPKETPSNHALIDCKLKNANMQIRLATKQEVCLIKEAVVYDKAVLEYKFDKNKIISLLDLEIKRL